MIITKVPPYIKAVYISLLIIIIIFVMILAKPILVPLLLSGYMAMLMTPFCNRLERVKFPRTVSAFIAVLLIVSIISGILYFAFSQIKAFTVDKQANMVDKINVLAVQMNSSVKQMIGYDIGMGYGLKVEKVLSLIESGDTNVAAMLFSTIDTLSNLLLLPIFIFFLLIYRDHIAMFITKVFERQRNKILIEHMVAIRRIVYAYIVGAGKVMLILGIVNSAVLLMLGIEHAIFFGMFAGFLNIIPYIGPFFGALMPFAVALLTKDSLFYPFAVVVSFTVIQFLESSFLTPKITGSNVNLNAFITFIGLLVGAAIWGIVGMILIIPTLAIMKKLFELSPDTEPYAYLFGEEEVGWFKVPKSKK